jgi:hypothetical protein
VFEDELGTGGRSLPDLFQLGFGVQGDPIHSQYNAANGKRLSSDNLYKNFLRARGAGLAIAYITLAHLASAARGTGGSTGSECRRNGHSNN